MVWTELDNGLVKAKIFEGRSSMLIGQKVRTSLERISGRLVDETQRIAQAL